MFRAGAALRHSQRRRSSLHARSSIFVLPRVKAAPPRIPERMRSGSEACLPMQGAAAADVAWALLQKLRQLAIERGEWPASRPTKAARARCPEAAFARHVTHERDLP